MGNVYLPARADPEASVTPPAPAAPVHRICEGGRDAIHDSWSSRDRRHVRLPSPLHARPALLTLLSLLVLAAGCGGDGPLPDELRQNGQPLTGCLPSATEAAINAVLKGAGAKAVLCPGAVFALNAPVKFTAPGQQLYTAGLPVDTTRATLRIASAALTNAIDGNGQSDIVIRNVQVDGNRGALGPRTGTALILIGGSGSRQTVQSIVARNTRSWSTIHAYEGHVTNDVPQCQGATIINNTIGPAGTPFDSGGPWADGISLACGNSLVRNNTVTDATDGAIVVFGAPGSLVQNNTVVARSRALLGGINMVDFDPVHGNYRGTRVVGNTIDARGAQIKVGIGMGPDIWVCAGSTVYGGTVTGNVLKGSHFGYGYAVNGVSQFTVTGNRSLARHIGVPRAGCGGTPSLPQAFQRQRYAASTLQPEFRAAQLTYLLGVSEPLSLPLINPISGCGWMRRDQGLLPGQSLSSCDGRFKLALQRDSNLVLYMGTTALWASNTVGTSAAEVIMQGDGNLVIYDSAGRAVWAANIISAGASLALQNDGNLVIYSAGGQPLWATHTEKASLVAPPSGCGAIRGAQGLVPGRSVRSCDGRFTLVLQGDSNLVLYMGATPLWASNTVGRSASYLVMQGDGNLVLYNTAGGALWATNTISAGSFLAVQNDGNLVIYNASYWPLWASNTAGH